VIGMRLANRTQRAEQPLGPDGKLGQSCDWCNKPFAPRRGTGGTKQKFCSRDCQRTSNRERQRTQRRGSYAGPPTFPASRQPTRNKTLPREPAIAALHRWETGVLDIASCERTEFVVSLTDGETAGTRIETWPPEVRALVEQHLNSWMEENQKARSIRAMTVAAPKRQGIQCCVLIVHHGSV
jgi:hypothetical protein